MHILYIHFVLKLSFLLIRFSPGDTNLVLREFEKCGVILKHVPGPGDANWMHILYQVLFHSCIYFEYLLWPMYHALHVFIFNLEFLQSL